MYEKLMSNEKLWAIYTAKEEYNPLFVDIFQRFPLCLSKTEDILRPSVSEFLVNQGLSPEYQDGKKFAICLTHDIDNVFMPTSSVSTTLKTQQRNSTITFRLSSKKSMANFAQIMSLESKYEVKSSFYFLALNKGEKDFNFKLEDIQTEMGNIVDRGWEIGLHGGHNSYNNIDRMRYEKARLEKVLGKKVIGYRNHYLRFKTPTTWNLLKELGFKYDTTFCHASNVGFRNGMCHPFKPYDLNINDFIDIIEIPLIIMDNSLFEYMRLDLKNAWKLVKSLIDITAKNKGVLTLLWHNTSMVGNRLKFYEHFLEYSRQNGAWLTSGENLYNWWTKNC